MSFLRTRSWGDFACIWKDSTEYATVGIQFPERAAHALWLPAGRFTCRTAGIKVGDETCVTESSCGCHSKNGLQKPPHGEEKFLLSFGWSEVFKSLQFGANVRGQETFGCAYCFPFCFFTIVPHVPEPP